MHTSAGKEDSLYQEPPPLRIARRFALSLSLEKEIGEELVWDSLAVARPAPVKNRQRPLAEFESERAPATH